MITFYNLIENTQDRKEKWKQKLQNVKEKAQTVHHGLKQLGHYIDMRAAQERGDED